MTQPKENVFAYSAPIWDRFTAPRHAGELVQAADVSSAVGGVGAGVEVVAGEVVTGQAGTPSARSVLRIQLCWVEGRVTAARFKAYGCPSSIAVGEWLCAWSSGRTVEELQGISAAQLRNVLEIPDDRAHCALLGEDALRAALDEYQRKSATANH